MKDLMDSIKPDCKSCGEPIGDDSLKRYKQRGNYCFQCNLNAHHIRYKPLYKKSEEKAREALPIDPKIAKKYNITEI